MSERGEYRAIRRVLLDGPDFQKLSERARWIFVVLKINLGPAGIDVFYPEALVAQLAAQSGAPAEGVRAAMDELEAHGWVAREANVVWIKGQLKNDPHVKQADKKHCKAIQRHVSGLPRLAIVAAFMLEHRGWFRDDTRPDGGPPEGLAWAFQGPLKHKPEDKPENKPDDDGAALPPPPPTQRDFIPEPYRASYDAAIRGANNPDALIAELTMLESGERGRRFTWDVIGRALHEMAVAGKPVTPILLRGFCRKVLEDSPESSTTSTAPGQMSRGERARWIWEVAREFHLTSPVPDILARIDVAVAAQPADQRDAVRASLLAVKIWELGTEKEERFAVKRIEERLGDGDRRAAS